MWSRRFLIPAASLVAVLAGCGEAWPDPNALAAAKCGSALHERLPPDGGRLVQERVEVTDLGGGRREVRGLIRAEQSREPRSFVCVVAPDASDKLRGLRVERLTVEGSTALGRSLHDDLGSVSIGDRSPLHTQRWRSETMAG